MHADDTQAMPFDVETRRDGPARFKTGYVQEFACRMNVRSPDKQGISMPAHAFAAGRNRDSLIVRMQLKQPIRQHGMAWTEASVRFLQSDYVSIELVQHIDDPLGNTSSVRADGLANIVGGDFDH